MKEHRIAQTKTTLSPYEIKQRILVQKIDNKTTYNNNK